MDGSEHPIVIGDHVRVHRIKGQATDRAVALMERWHVFTVVHVHESYLFLDAGEDVGYSVDRGFSPHFRERIPPELNRDPTWWARMSILRSVDCEVIA